MKKNDLSKRVLASVLTMSCVYLGGSYALPVAVAAPVHEKNQVKNETKVYEDGSTITVNGIAVTANGAGKTTDITANGVLEITGNAAKSASVVGEQQGQLIFRGDKLVINYNGDNGAGLAALDSGSVILKNALTQITSNNFGIEVFLNSTMAIEKDLEITVTGVNPTTGDIYGIIVSNGSSFDIQGKTIINVSTNDVDAYAMGINLWGGSANAANSASFNGVDINVAGGADAYGINVTDNVNKLDFKGTTNIEVKDAYYQNVGIFLQNIGAVASFGDVNVTASGGEVDHALGILLDGSSADFNGVTQIKASGNALANAGMYIDLGSTVNMGQTFIDADGGETAVGIQLSHDSILNLKDSLFIKAQNGQYDNAGIHVFTNSQFNGIDVVITTVGDNSHGVYVVDKSAAELSGALAIDIQGDTGTGLKVSNNSSFAGNTGVIKVAGRDGTGVYANNGGQVSFADKVTIDAETAAYVNGNSNNNTRIDFKKDFISVHDNSKITALNAGVVDINSSGQGVVMFQGTTSVGHNKDNPKDGVINMKLQGGGSYWNVTGNSSLTDLQVQDAIIDMRSDNNTYSTLVTNKLSGTGGVIKLDIDVRNDDSDKIEVKENFSGSQIIDIYQKDNYVPLADSTEGHGLVLASVNGDGEFTAKDREGTLFYTHYDLAKKASAESDYDFDWYLDKIIKLDPDDQTTTSVETILSANALNYHTWRTENDKLLQRMGELRNNGENAQGAWFKVSGSKIGRSGRFDFANKYTGYELGYDEVTKRTEAVTSYQGVALSYTDGSSGYSRGSGDNSGKGISFYNTELGSKGHYLDVVLKISNMDSDFAVYDTDSKKITGDFNNTGVALSAEYGRKNALHNGWYIEPQAQFTLGYLGGDSYTASNGIEVSQSGIKSAVGRIGFNIGREVGSKGVVYAKANLLHEFGGGYEVAMHDGSGAVTVSESFRDTWFEYGIGAALQTSKNNQIYFDVERSGGSEFKKDWQWNIGARWMF